MRFIINDFDIYYEKYGNSKSTILILPGWGDTRGTFTHIINCFRKNFTIYILDYPGFGESKFPNRDLSLSDYTRLIKDFIAYNNIKNPIIIAHSFGGRIAIDLASSYSVDINKIILIDSAGIKPKTGFMGKFKKYLYKFLKKIGLFLTGNLKQKYMNFLISVFGSTDFKSLSNNMRNTFIKIINYDLSNKLSNILVPTLLIWGNRDFDTPINDGYVMKKSIKDSGLVIINNAGHFSYLDYPSYVDSIIYEFVKEDIKKDT